MTENDKQQYTPTNDLVETIQVVLTKQRPELSLEMLVGTRAEEVTTFGAPVAILLRELRLRDQALQELHHLYFQAVNEHEQYRRIVEKVSELDRIRIEIDREAILKSTDTEKLTALRMRRSQLERELQGTLHSSERPRW